jgi:molybdopterin-biosynthesis enzyme MoeA-like protein
MKPSAPTKAEIIAKIQRIANDVGKAPGVAVFTQLSGVPQHCWYGKFWARWSDALAEAGYANNELQRRFSSDEVLTKVLEASLRMGKIPTNPEMKMIRSSDDTFPNPKTVAAHFGSRSELIEAIRTECNRNSKNSVLYLHYYPRKQFESPHQQERKQDGSTF